MTVSMEQSQRQRWMSVLAKAQPKDLEVLWDNLPQKPGWQTLRRPEVGMVMVRGRAGGTGMRFNLGEMTVTRCTVRLDNGMTGHGYVSGRNKRHAELSAVVDAMMQDPDCREDVRDGVVEPLCKMHDDARQAAAVKAGATKVDFFTVVRGDD